ncbi:MAG: hypothetical protein O9972_39725 [Burkholderiales bacterium]|nr:hypothetical protein [Burkholderiales bacterium]
MNARHVRRIPETLRDLRRALSDAEWQGDDTAAARILRRIAILEDAAERGEEWEVDF